MTETRPVAAPGTDGGASRTFTIAVFDGDGIGPEVMRPTVALLQRMAARSGAFRLDVRHLPAGAAHYRQTGEALPAEAMAQARGADAILLSAMGLPEIRYPDGTEIAPQIELRKVLDLYAGVRPVTVRPGQGSPLKAAEQGRIDFVILRESTEGLFASHGKGQVLGTAEARETLVITRAVSEKLFDFAFRLAARRLASGAGRGMVHCVDKANVFQAFAFFRSIFDERAARHPDIAARHAYVDATALWMVQRPEMFDVIVTENMFGDILSDLGAGIMGSLGLAPSADIGDRHAVFQPCHGSAPDIAGRDLANPMAMLLSGAMMLEWLADTHAVPAMAVAAGHLRAAVDAQLDAGTCLTADLGGRAGTEDVAAEIESRCLAGFAA